MARRLSPTLGVLLIASLAAACQESPTRPTAASTPAVTGTVQDTFGEPISGARVEMIDGPLAGRWALTTSAGRFSIPLDGRSPQGISLRISKEGFASASQLIDTSVVLLIVLESTEPFTLHGDYTLTLAAAPACQDIPSTLRSRAYTAKLRRRGTANRMFTVELGGADFYPGYGTLFGTRRDMDTTFWISSVEAFDNWLEEQPIFERLPSSAYVSFVGTATTSLDPNGAIMLSWDGVFAYCPSFRPDANPLWPPVCTMPVVRCQSTLHQLVLVNSQR